MNIKDIYIIENFVNDNSLEKLQNFVRTTNEWEPSDSALWNGRNINTRNVIDPEIKSICQGIEFKKKNKIVELFSPEKDISPELFLFSRRFPTPGEVPHSDSSGNSGEDNGTSHRKYSSLLYLNDDFVGGELHFPNQEFTFVPKPNTAVFFPSTFEYIHGVKDLHSGMRYTMLAFWVYNDINAFDLRKG